MNQTKKVESQFTYEQTRTLHNEEFIRRIFLIVICVIGLILVIDVCKNSNSSLKMEA
jgi:hypothetical protein